MIGRTCWLVLGILFVSGCANMKPEDFKDATPKLVLEDYFAGQTRAWGMFEDRFGSVRRQFSVDITGTWDGETLILRLYEVEGRDPSRADVPLPRRPDW